MEAVIHSKKGTYYITLGDGQHVSYFAKNMGITNTECTKILKEKYHMLPQMGYDKAHFNRYEDALAAKAWIENTVIINRLLGN